MQDMGRCMPSEMLVVWIGGSAAWLILKKSTRELKSPLSTLNGLNIFDQYLAGNTRNIGLDFIHSCYCLDHADGKTFFQFLNPLGQRGCFTEKPRRQKCLP
jgi:hypothetical protein